MCPLNRLSKKFHPLNRLSSLTVSPERLPPRDRAREWSDSPQFPHGGRYRAGAVSPYGHELGADIDSSEQDRYSQSLAELTKSDDSDWDQRMVASFRESWDTRKQLTSAWDEVFALPGLVAPTRGLFLDKMIKGEDEPLRIGFPNARDMVQLLGEAQIALGMEAENGLLSGAPLGMILPLGARANRALGGGDFFGDETPMWDTAVQFYRERYDFTQPGWAEAFGEVLATDMAGVIGDFAAAASLAGLSAKGASVASKAAARASRQLGIKMDGRLAKAGCDTGKLASKAEKFGEQAEGFNRRINQSMVSPEQLFNIAKAPGVLRALGRFGRRWGAADMELATLPFVAAAELWRMKLKRAGEAPVDVGLQDHILSQRKLEGVEIEMMARNPLPEMPTEMVDNAITANRGVRGSTVQLIGSTPKSPLNVMDAENTVFELDDIIYSHSSTGVANEVYPQEYQQRDRSTGESLDMVRDRAENLAPEMLIQNSSSVTEGSPILVLKDGKFYALGGNGRLMSMEIAYGGGRGQDYKDYLTEQASSLGLDSAQIQGMNKPVMVRVIKSELTETQRIEASRLFNLSAAEMQRAGEIATEDVRQITPGLLLGFNLTTESSLDRMLVQPSNQQVLSDFINRLPESERASLLTDGAPNQQAVQRFTNAMIIRAYGDNPEFRSMLIETNEGLKNIQNAALGIAPKVIEMKIQIEQGIIPPTIDFTAALAEAVPFFNEILRNEAGAREATIAEYYKYHEEHPDLFGTQAKRLTPEGTLFAHFLEQNHRKPRVMREALTKYIDEALKLEEDRDMFNPSLPTKKELYRQAFEGRVSNLDELLEDVPDIAETTQNIETTVAEAGEQIEQARDTVDVDANTTEYSNRMIEILEGLGRNIDEQGQQVIEQAIQEARGTGQVSDESLFQIGRLGESLTVEVVDAIRQAFESEGRPTEWLDNLSIHAYGDIQRGLEESARLGEVDPESAFPPVHQAYSYERLQQWDEMEVAARQAVEKDSTDVYAQAALGRALTHKGQFDEAIEVFDNLITNNPDDAYAHISRAETKRKMGDTEGADADIERAEEIQFGDPSEDTMSVDDARREFGEKVGAEERELTAEAATFRGLNHFKAGRYSQAIARAEEAVRLDPNNALAHGILGYSYYGKGRASRRTGNMEESNTFFEDAANSFRKALEIEPDNVYSLNGMAWYHYRKGQHSQARYYREQARLAESGERMAGRGVAEIESELAEVQSTLQDLENRVTALEDSPDVEQLRTQADNLESELAEARSREDGEIDDAESDRADTEDALTLLDEAEITIELNDEGQKVAKYQGLDEDGNPHEVTTTFDADIPDDEVRQRTQELIDAEKEGYQQVLDEGERYDASTDTRFTDISDELKDDTGNPITVHHGSPTGSELQAFDPERLGEVTGADSAQQGFFFTDNPRVAETYRGVEGFEADRAGFSETLDNIRVEQQPDGTFEVANTNLGRFNTQGEAETAAEAARRGLAESLGIYDETISDRQADSKVIDAHLVMKNPLVVTAQDLADRYDNSLSRAIEEAKSQGHDGVIFKEIHDPYDVVRLRREDYGTEAEYNQGLEQQRADLTGTHYVVFDANQIINAETGRTMGETPDEGVVTAAADDDVPFDAPDDDMTPEAEAVRQPSQLPLNQVEEFYQFLLDKAKDVDDPMLNEYVQALDGLTEDIVQGLAEIDPRIEGITDAFEDAKQIVGNKATFDYLDFIRNTLGNDVTDAPKYANVVNQLMENIDSPENAQRILEQLNENDIDRFRGVVLQNMWERWADGGADDLAKLNENGQLEALLGTGIANSIRMWDEIVEDYIRPDPRPEPEAAPDPRPETAPDRPPEPETVADENLPRTPEGELPRKPEDILPEDELLPHEERAEHRLNIKRRRKAIVEAERNRTIRALANIRNSFAYRASLGFSAGAVGLGAYQGAGWLIAGGAFALVNAAALEAIVHIADKRNLRKSIREGVPHVEDAIQRGKGEPAIINLLEMMLDDAKRQNILPSLRILKESSQIREDDERLDAPAFGEFATSLKKKNEVRLREPDDDDARLSTVSPIESVVNVNDLQPTYTNESQLEERDISDVSPMARSELEGAIKAIEEKSGTKIQTELRELYNRIASNEYVSLLDHKINSLEELAFLSDVYRHRGLERHHVFFMKGNRIIAHHAATINNHTSATPIFSSEIKARVEKLGADGVMDMHNHPNGGSRFSSADKHFIRKNAENLGGLYKGSIIINGNRYGEAKLEGDEVRFNEHIDMRSIEVEHWEATTGLEVNDYRRIGETYTGTIDKIFGVFEDPMRNVSDEDKRKIAERVGVDLHEAFGEIENTETLDDVTTTLIGGDLFIEKPDDYAKWVAGYGQSLKTRDNWMTLIVTDADREKMAAMVAYKNLHLLDPKHLAAFIGLETSKWGGDSSILIVGEGDWYSTPEEVDEKLGHAIQSEVGLNTVWANGLDNPYFFSDVRYFEDTQFETTRESEIYEHGGKRGWYKGWDKEKGVYADE